MSENTETTTAIETAITTPKSTKKKASAKKVVVAKKAPAKKAAAKKGAKKPAAKAKKSGKTSRLTDNPVTKYGARSNPGKGHHFSWPEMPGEGTGKCRYCEARLKFVPKGPRGGKVRMYSKDGKSWSEKEFACDTKAHENYDPKAA